MPKYQPANLVGMHSLTSTYVPPAPEDDNTVALGTTGNTHLADGYGPFGGFGPPGGFTGANSLAPDPKTLGAIAHLTQGEFFRARTSKALQDAYTTLGSKLGQTVGHEEVTGLFAFGAAVLLVLAAIVAALWAPRLP